MEGILEKLEAGHGTEADVAKLEQLTGNIMGMTICALGDAAAMPVQSFLKKFKDEFLQHAREHRCPYGDQAWGLDQSSREARVGDMVY
jgi:NADH-quinone oxidoreductase subunit F